MLTIDGAGGDDTFNVLGGAGLTEILGGEGGDVLNVAATNRFSRTTFDGVGVARPSGSAGPPAARRERPRRVVPGRLVSGARRRPFRDRRPTTCGTSSNSASSRKTGGCGSAATWTTPC
ncbi:MAG: hypothetical protein WKF75_00635 [Singulisphaera sp.]